MKVYVCLESRHEHETMEPQEKAVSVIGVFSSYELAEKEIDKRLGDVAYEITAGDDNNGSRISEIQTLCGGAEAAIESEWCDRWEWRIVEESVCEE